MPQLTRQVPDGAIFPGFNDEASTSIAAKRLVIRDTSATVKHGVAIAAAATSPFAGVTNEEILAGHSGDVQRAGKTILTAGAGGVTVGARITSDGAGKGIITTTEDNNVAGQAETVAAENADFEITLTLGVHVP